MKIQDYFRRNENATPTHSWVLVSYNAAMTPGEELAQELAYKIAAFQLRGALHHYYGWKLKVETGALLSSSTKQALLAFFRTIFGPPGDYNAVPAEHLQGYIGQMLWFFICEERQSDESIVRIEPPGFKSTDAGGDGLVVHRLQGDTLMFRLWEMKKYVPTSVNSTTSVSSTIANAYTQLNANATEYLARYTAIGQELRDDPELSQFYSQLVDFWIDATEQAGCGVSVATSPHCVPNSCYSTFGTRFPRFTNQFQRRGMLTAIDDFAAFSQRVQEIIWSGL
jgi:hypothetical protein